MADALAGIRILDHGIVQAGTYPARLFADFGAEVIRVENYVRPDLSRNYIFPEGQPGERYWEHGGPYHEQHRNKPYCVGVDLTNPAGRDVFLRLVRECDVMLDSHPPDVLEKLNLSFERLREVKPNVILVSTSGYGVGGPYSTTRSYGMMTEIMSGISWLNRYPGEEPRRGNLPLTDHPATYHIAFLMLAALERRERTGEGCWVDVSQYELGINMVGDVHLARAFGAELPRLQGNAEGGAPLAGCFRCDDGERWVAVEVCDREAWRGLCALVGLDRLETVRNPWSSPLDEIERSEVADAVSVWLSGRHGEDAVAELQRRHVPAAVVTDVRDLLLDRHLEERGFFWLVDHDAQQGAGRRAWPGPSAQLSRTPAELRARAPMLGEHNHRVATKLLGLTEREYEELVASGALGTLPAAAAVEMPVEDPTARTKLPASSQARLAAVDQEYLDRLRARFGSEFGPVAAEPDGARG